MDVIVSSVVLWVLVYATMQKRKRVDSLADRFLMEVREALQAEREKGSP